MSVRTILLAVFVLVAGCLGMKPAARNATHSADPGVGAADMGGGDEGGYYDEDGGDDMAMEMDAEAPAMAGEIASVPAVKKATAPEPEPRPEPADDKPQVGPGKRHIVYTASMTVSVFNLDEAMQLAEAIPGTHGGYIQSMDIGLVVLRIPSESLRKVMDEVSEYGVVEQRSLRSQDVTAEFVDIESRLSRRSRRRTSSCSRCWPKRAR